MTYTYIPASIAAEPTKGASPKDTYNGLFQATLTKQFYNSSNWWTIQEELTPGTKEYTDVDVRISHVINAETGLKLGDDWKTLYFEEIDHNIDLGRRYTFDDSTWVTTNTEQTKNIAGTCTIRRCNNTLRWIDEATGAYYEEPCAIEYLVKEPRDYATTGSPFMTPGGFLHIEMQFNEHSNLINQNQRFLFGNPNHWMCYKVIGTGINDFRNKKTYDNTTAKILSLDLLANFVNDELDDVVNGIADVYTNVYTVTMDKNTAEGQPAGTVQLSTAVTYNGDTTTRTMEWSSSDDDIATVDSNGLVTLVALGSCVITASIEDNPANDTCAITVTATPTDNVAVVISPDTNYILEGKSKTYTVYLYINDVQQADAFTVTCDGHSVISTSYTFTQDTANSFTVSNILRDPSSYLTISCVSGVNSKDFDIQLNGAW